MTITTLPSSTILEKLRHLMKSKLYYTHNLAAYIITSSDAHNSEYTAEYDKRREYLSKFTGSAGTCVVTEDKALLWTDGRYFLQAAEQLDENWTLMKSGLSDTPKISEWLATNVPEGSYIGSDSLLTSYGEWKQLSKYLKTNNRSLIPVSKNLIDVIWQEDGKKEMPFSNIFIHPITYAGDTWQQKVDKIRLELNKKKVDALFLSSLDCIAWLFNLRGHDIMCCPVFKSYVILTKTTIDLFLHVDKLSDEVLNHLTSSNDSNYKVNIRNYHEIQQYLLLLCNDNIKIWINNSSPAAFALNFSKKKLLLETCPVTIAKSIKNKNEQQGIEQACIRDSAALCEYFGFLEDEVPKYYLTEVTAAKYLGDLRKKMDKFVDLSFPAISSTGPNSAIIHYSPQDSKIEKLIDPNAIYLCDSGAQYWDGTTDITRTVHYGVPTAREILAYTMVLKGHINLAKAIFPENTKGHSLDVLARSPLWSLGLDYLHGTGHGIGCFLNVHEGPQNISVSSLTDYQLFDGVLLSNEPGYYEDGKFGIRIENMMFVREIKDMPNNFKDKKYYTFETVSLVPMQRELINTKMLTNDEIDWLNKYHKKCVDLVAPVLEQKNMYQGLRWLTKQTQPIFYN